jgi:hypothetical protein
MQISNLYFRIYINLHKYVSHTHSFDVFSGNFLRFPIFSECCGSHPKKKVIIADHFYPGILAKLINHEQFLLIYTVGAIMILYNSARLSG